MKTLFPKTQLHIPKFFLINAFEKTLGRLATEISLLLCGKLNSYFTPGIDQGNFLILFNVIHITVSNKKKEVQKMYYRNSQRPGSLKSENFKQLKIRLTIRIIEKAIKGMLPKGVLGRKYYKRLYIYKKNKINFLYKK